MTDLHASTDIFRLLSDPNRIRLLALLETRELTVDELTRATSLGQSRVSTHLGKLRESGLVVDRRDGRSSYYRLNGEEAPGGALRAWSMARDHTRDPILEKDRERLQGILRGTEGADPWADSVAGRMDRNYSPGRTWEATAWGALGLAELGDVLDVASGDGVLAQLLSARSRSVTCLDRSPKVSVAGKKRLRKLDNVRFRQGDMHHLPFKSGVFDQALLLNALTYSTEPDAALREIFRVLRPGGAFVAATLHVHEYRSAVEKYNHVRLGFEVEDLRSLVLEAGFEVDLCEVTSREKRRPYFEVITVHARKPRVDSEGR